MFEKEAEEMATGYYCHICGHTANYRDIGGYDK